MKALLGVLLAAAGYGQDMAGRYVLRGVMETASELALKPDGAFEYMLVYGAADYQARGTWRVENGAVILNTSGAEKPAFRLAGGEAAGHPGVLVWVKGPGGQPVQQIRVKLESAKGMAEGRTGAEGAAEFPGAASPRSVSFEVPVYGVKAGPFALDPKQDDFRFEIDGEAITRVPFRNERLRIDGQSLELRFWNPEKAMVYTRR
jgi:hypothetical protein